MNSLLKVFLETFINYIVTSYNNYKVKKEIEPIKNKIKDFLKK